MKSNSSTKWKFSMKQLFCFSAICFGHFQTIKVILKQSFNLDGSIVQ